MGYGLKKREKYLWLFNILFVIFDGYLSYEKYLYTKRNYTINPYFFSTLLFLYIIPFSFLLNNTILSFPCIILAFTFLLFFLYSMPTSLPPSLTRPLPPPHFHPAKLPPSHPAAEISVISRHCHPLISINSAATGVIFGREVNKNETYRREGRRPVQWTPNLGLVMFSICVLVWGFTYFFIY